MNDTPRASASAGAPFLARLADFCPDGAPGARLRISCDAAAAKAELAWAGFDWPRSSDMPQLFAAPLSLQ